MILYRGDSSHISEFMVGRTQANCLYGRGIYLTDSKKVAETYRIKDVPSRHRDKQSNILIDGYFKSFDEAMLEAFNKFSKRVDPQGNFLVREYAGKIYPRHTQLIKQRWEAVKDLLIIDKRNPSSIPRDIGIQLLHYKIVLPILPAVGKISIFNFPNQELMHNTVSVHRCLNQGIINLINDELHIDFKALHIHTFNGYKSFPWNKLSRIIMPYGYIGLTYRGGANGNDINHTCFVIWDEEYVNRHRIS
jgi:hypothetical protein